MKRGPRQLIRDEYLAEMTERFGPQARNWKVECPICGIIYALSECGDSAETAQRGLFGCIGRINGKGGTAFGEKRPNIYGCDFAANGLFRSPWLFFETQMGAGEAVGIMPIAPADAPPAAPTIEQSKGALCPQSNL